jgi:hypothetical protein
MLGRSGGVRRGPKPADFVLHRRYSLCTRPAPTEEVAVRVAARAVPPRLITASARRRSPNSCSSFAPARCPLHTGERANNRPESKGLYINDLHEPGQS